MSKEMGLKYRCMILQPGGSRPEMELLQELLGRDPSSEAYFQELLEAESSNSNLGG